MGALGQEKIASKVDNAHMKRLKCFNGMVMDLRTNTSLSLATSNAFHVCASIAAHWHGILFVICEDTFFAEALRERILPALAIECVILPATGMPQVVESRKEDLENGFGLIWITPKRSQRNEVSRLLTHPHLKWLTVVDVSALGRKMLAEWRTNHEDYLPETTIQRMFQAFSSEARRQYAIGNIRSILWGAAAGQMMQIRRPDLADRCLALMRRHLAPSEKNWFLPFLLIRSAIREDVV